ncbi:MAG: hypothetical protein ABIN91_02445 [Mucilaginibacter sp.]|uniref:hypothetical protein n=1 Tax=Mucilaginibacter sp. TaxID=1882438 RepID=UPI003264E24F
MKKLMIFLSMIMLVDRTYAQKKYYLDPVAIDNSVTVSLPKEFTKTNVNGQESFAANGQYGTMFVIRSMNPATAKDVKNADGLDKVFKEYVKKVQNSSGKGVILEDHDVTMGKLTARDFTLQTDTGSGVQSRHFRLIYTKNITYTFEYLYDDVSKDIAAGEMNAFFSSIKTDADMDHTDQYVVSTQSDHSIFTKIIFFGLIPLALIIGIVIYFKRRDDTMTLT